MLGRFRKKQRKGRSGPYAPPEMPPFPKDYNGVMEALAPYYAQGRPLGFFFELYVVNVLGKLPEETRAALSDFAAKHPALFADQHGDWEKYVSEGCDLSDTIEIAIWDLWIKNLEHAKRDGWEYHPWHFARNFADNYFAEESRVDVWEGDALQEARKRLAAYRGGG